MLRSRDLGILLLIVGAGVAGRRLLLPALGGVGERVSTPSGEAPAASGHVFEPGCATPFIATSLTSGFSVVAEYAGTAGLTPAGLVVEAPRMVIRARPDRAERLWAIEVGLAAESADGRWSIVRSGQGWVLDTQLAGGEVLEPGGRTWTIPGVKAADLEGRWIVFSHVLESGQRRAWTYAHADRETLAPIRAGGCTIG